jgi:hypothetical protein
MGSYQRRRRKCDWYMVTSWHTVVATSCALADLRDPADINRGRVFLWQDAAAYVSRPR